MILFLWIPLMGSCWKKAFLQYLAGSCLADEYTIIVVESDLHTSFDYVEGLSLHIYKEKIYKTNKHVFIEKR